MLNILLSIFYVQYLLVLLNQYLVFHIVGSAYKYAGCWKMTGCPCFRIIFRYSYCRQICHVLLVYYCKSNLRFKQITYLLANIIGIVLRPIGDCLTSKAEVRYCKKSFYLMVHPILASIVCYLICVIESEKYTFPNIRQYFQYYVWFVQ